MIDRHTAFLNDLRSLKLSLTRDLTRAYPLLDRYLSTHLPASLSPSVITHQHCQRFLRFIIETDNFLQSAYSQMLYRQVSSSSSGGRGGRRLIIRDPEKLMAGIIMNKSEVINAAI